MFSGYALDQLRRVGQGPVSRLALGIGPNRNATQREICELTGWTYTKV
jgi:hypothetical protein